MNLGKVFKKAREARGETQRAFAAKLGVTPVALWKIESGRALPKQKTIQKFLEETGMCLAELYINAFEKEDYATSRECESL